MRAKGSSFNNSKIPILFDIEHILLTCYTPSVMQVELVSLNPGQT